MKEMIPPGNYTVLAEAPAWVWVLGGATLVIIFLIGITVLLDSSRGPVADPNNETPPDKESGVQEPKNWFYKLITLFSFVLGILITGIVTVIVYMLIMELFWPPDEGQE